MLVNIMLNLGKRSKLKLQQPFSQLFFFIQHESECEAILDNFVVSAQNCLLSMMNFSIMEIIRKLIVKRAIGPLG